MCPTTDYIHMKGAQTWTLQKANNGEWREMVILKQTHFSGKQRYATTQKYTDL
jgi:hypothetical protein